jgi:hypothetical protein
MSPLLLNSAEGIMSKPMNLRTWEMNHRNGEGIRAAAVRFLVCGLAVLASAWPCWAAPQTVNNTNDSGPGSLRDAIASAAPGDTIQFNLASYPGVIALSSTLEINTNLTIQGPGAAQLAISGNHAVSVFVIDPGVNVSISGLTIENGQGFIGGGIENNGTLTVTYSTLSGNSALYGGGIENYGTLTVTNSTLSGNSASDGGGGINNDSTLTITNSTLSHNSAHNGAGIRTSSGEGHNSLTVANSTLSGNSASAGGGFEDDPAVKFTAKGTLLAGNQGGNCGGIGLTSQNYNLSDDYSCLGFIHEPADLDPNGLQNNGGPTPTIALLPTSPAVDAIPVSACTDTQGAPITADQRGVKRPQGAGCDIGAFELVQNTPFSYFNANLAILTGKPSGFGLMAWLTLASGSNGIHPLTEAVTLQIANYSVTIPVGSFQQLWNGSQAPYVYEGTISGTKLVVGLIPLGNNNYQFDAAGSPVAFAGIRNPVHVSLTIGDDAGSTAVTAVISSR